MTDFDKEFDELLKNALNNDSELNGLTMDDELIASTMKAIDEAAPRKEEIRASYDESFGDSAMEAIAASSDGSNDGSGKGTLVALHEERPVEGRKEKKSFFTKGNIAIIFSVVAGVAALVVAVVFMNGNFASKEAADMSMSETATYDYVSTEAAAPRAMIEEAEQNETAKSESAVFGGYVGSGGNGGNGAGVNGFTAPADDGLYYFEDESLYAKKEETSGLLDNVYTVYDKTLYKPIYDLIRSSAIGEPVVFEEGKGTNEVAADSTSVPEENSTEAGSAVSAGDEKDDEELDITDPQKLAEALKESKEMLENTGGLPSENVEEVIGSIEVGDETYPDFEYAPEKNPFWTPIEDASDETLSAYAPIIVVYDKDERSDFDVCVQVFEDRCVVYDFAIGSMTTYTVENGKDLAEEIHRIVSQ
ncbi:MAG: hypothetical protein K6F93_05875 [Lachnospiraceae bacterium]|nr:hypothetical protein [Lachnospiraceae bacterium]